MAQTTFILYQFIYKFAIAVIFAADLSFQDEKKYVFMATFLLFAVYNGSIYYCNPLIYSAWLLVSSFLAWTSFLIYLIPHLKVISTMSENNYDTDNIFWYVWGYSTPCLLCYVIFGNFAVDRTSGWQSMFTEEKH